MKKRLSAVLLSLLLTAALGACASVGPDDMAVGDVQEISSAKVAEAV